MSYHDKQTSRVAHAVSDAARGLTRRTGGAEEVR